MPHKKFIANIESLPPLPAIVQRVAAVGDSPETSSEDLANILREDQALAARVLCVANSPYYGVSRRINQVSLAVAMLGTVNVRSLVVGLAARSVWPTGTTPSGEHDMLWRHSIAVASAAELVAKAAGFHPVEPAFVAGLLHDIGRLAMLTFEPEAFRRALGEARCTSSLRRLERRYIGLDHTQAGHHILSRWGLPEELCQATLTHHDRRIVGHGVRADLCAIVMIADACAHMMGVGLDIPLGCASMAEPARDHLGLSEEQLLDVLDRLERRVVELTAMIHVAATEQLADHHAPARRVAWISDDLGRANKLGQFVLQHYGCTLRHLAPADVGEGVPDVDLVIVSMATAGLRAARTIAGRIGPGGRPSVVLLRDPKRDEPLRRHDEETGAIEIPCRFTVCDVEWALRHRGGATPLPGRRAGSPDRGHA